MYITAVQSFGEFSLPTGTSIIACELIFLVMHLLTISPTRGVKVFSLQPNIWEAPRDDVYIKYDFRTDARFNETKIPLSNFTICYRFQRTVFPTWETHFSYSVPPNETNALMYYYNYGLNGMVYTINGNRLNAKIFKKIPITLNTWIHYCHVLTDIYRLYIDGALVFSDLLYKIPNPVTLNGVLIIGQEQDEIDGGFTTREILRGYLAQFNIWDYPLELAVIQSLSSLKGNMSGNVFSSDYNELILTNVDFQEKSLDDLDNNGTNFIIMTGKVNFSEAARYCRQIASYVYTPMNKQEYDLFKYELEQNPQTGTEYIWLGLTDISEEGVYIAQHTNKTVPFIQKFQIPNGGVSEDCTLTSKTFHGITGASCSTAHLFTCFKTPYFNLKLRGLCFKPQKETLFIATSSPDGSPVLQGLFGYMVIYDEYEWKLIDTTKNSTIAILVDKSPDFYPMGRSVWKLQREQCGHAAFKEIVLSLSPCDSDQFMCDNSECVPINARCNYKAECSDLSDEGNCDVVSVPPAVRKDIPPENPKVSAPLPLKISINLLRIPTIQDSKDLYEMEFELYITWIDRRLTYRNLRSNQSTQTSENDMLKIWKPNILFLNAILEHMKMIIEYITVDIIHPPEDIDHNDVKMDIIYSGISAELTHYIHYTSEFGCTFDVFYYPLDTQICSMRIKLVTVNTGSVIFIEDMITAKYSGAAHLNAFRVADTRVIIENQKDNVIRIEFKLVRLPKYILVTTFGLTLMILLCGYTTLFLKRSLVQDRLIVSLTSLLVMFTYFSVTSSELPKTSYVKMIDIWYMFSCAIIFCIIVFHVSTEQMEDINDVIKLKLGRRRCLISIDTFSQIFRLIIIPGIVLLFMVIFWLKMAVHTY